MTEVRVNAKGLFINGVAVELPGNSLGTIGGALGAKPRLTKVSNDIYAWDAHGIYAYCSPAKFL